MNLPQAEIRPNSATSTDEATISLAPVFDVIRRYRKLIGLAFLVATVLFALIFLATVMLAPTERVASLEFRLLFPGVDQQQYPNGTPFSTSDIIAAPVVENVYQRNELIRYGTAHDFLQSVAVMQSNFEINLLETEYLAKLSDTRLTAADRARLETEFRGRLSALEDPVYRLILRRTSRVQEMPTMLVEKVLRDLLEEWARFSRETRGNTRHNVPALGSPFLRWEEVEPLDYMAAVDVLRLKADRLQGVAAALADLPGADAFRDPNGLTLAETRAAIDDLLRFRIEPFLNSLASRGLARDPEAARDYTQAQATWAQLRRDDLANRLEAVERALREYTAPTPMSARTEARDSGGGNAQNEAPVQLDTSFIDRILQMSIATQTNRYRQQLTDRILVLAENVAQTTREAQFYQRLAAQGGSRWSTPSSAMHDELTVQIRAIFNSLDAAARQLLSLQNGLDEALGSSTGLYQITSPFHYASIAAFDWRRWLLYYLFTMAAVAVLAPLACVGYDTLRARGRTVIAT